MPITAAVAGVLMITQNPLPYAERLESRNPDSIQGVVIHCTETPDLAMAREFGEQIHYAESQTGNSGHFYIDVDGSIEQYVPEDRIAHHVAGHNRHTIGIELVNRGRWPDWHHSDHQELKTAYPDVQINALQSLLGQLERQLPSLVWIAGHEQLDTREVAASNDPDLTVARKVDPGPLFPWPEVLEHSRLQYKITIDETN